jgi:hypothetical protein
MNRKLLAAGLIAVLGACQPAIPDSGVGVVDPGRGVGFENPAIRAAQLDAQNVPVTPTMSAQTLPNAQTVPQGQTAPRAVSDPQGLDRELSRNAARQDVVSTRANSGEAVLHASPSNAPPELLNNPGISDENNFDAVASRQSIESDAARIAANRQQYQVVQPTALPSRTGNRRPNVVEYALQTRHPKGTKVHRRLRIGSARRYQRNCAEYGSPDEAQIDFLARGGPKRDRRGLDPDGDGYACAWDPGPFRRASGS